MCLLPLTIFLWICSFHFVWPHVLLLLIAIVLNSFNQLDLPEYFSKDQLQERLLLAIHEGSEGFGFGWSIGSRRSLSVGLCFVRNVFLGLHFLFLVSGGCFDEIFLSYWCAEKINLEVGRSVCSLISRGNKLQVGGAFLQSQRNIPIRWWPQVTKLYSPFPENVYRSR
jgi:hypothetical protein